MSNRLPEQQETTGTYMELPTLQWLIKNRLSAGHPEGETSRVWNTILTETFQAKDGYTTGPEMTFGTGRADLFTAHLVFDVKHHEKKFLIVECKAPGLEGQDQVWAEAQEQLLKYLRSIKSINRKFGAIAVGRVVRFYEWIDEPASLVHFDGDQTAYYLDRQCQTVTEKLVYFRENHLIQKP